MTYYLIHLQSFIKIYPHPDIENSVYKLTFYDYNYLLTKKFKYLRNEAVLSADKLIFVVNIFDKRGIDNFKLVYDDAIKQKNNLNSNSQKKSEVICIMLKITSNFLIKINEAQISENIKKELYQLGIKNYIELEEENITNINSLLNEFIFR